MCLILRYLYFEYVHLNATIYFYCTRFQTQLLHFLNHYIYWIYYQYFIQKTWSVCYKWIDFYKNIQQYKGVKVNSTFPTLKRCLHVNINESVSQFFSIANTCLMKLVFIITFLAQQKSSLTKRGNTFSLLSHIWHPFSKQITQISQRLKTLLD